jgi:hypothetical protein
MAHLISEQGGEQRTPLKGCVRVRSPYTPEQYSPMFVVRSKCSPADASKLTPRYFGSVVAGWLGCEERRIQRLRAWARDGFVDLPSSRFKRNPTPVSDSALKSQENFQDDSPERDIPLDAVSSAGLPRPCAFNFGRCRGCQKGHRRQSRRLSERARERLRDRKHPEEEETS